MDILELIKQNENAKLDFKREWYWDSETSKQDIQKKRLELYKDIIAMTNGNIHYIGETAYLIIGVKEGLNAPNELHHVEFNVTALQKEIIQNVNNYANPLIQDLSIRKHTVDEKDIYVIEIPPHPYPIILKQDLKGLEKKGTLLIRAGEGTVVVDGADYETRKAFEEAVEKFYGEEKGSNVSITIHGDVKGVVNAESGSVIHQTIS
jgi:hypothetical protein